VYSAIFAEPREGVEDLAQGREDRRIGHDEPATSTNHPLNLRQNSFGIRVVVERKRAGHEVEGAVLVGQALGVADSEIGIPKLGLRDGYHLFREVKSEEFGCRSLFVNNAKESVFRTRYPGLPGRDGEGPLGR